ncbi:MAG: hypothetical protein EXQ85_03160 [Alphaproteobacteria bacterium]|nr:hypothetical protein [Alphaproteobacteria bacterium]
MLVVGLASPLTAQNRTGIGAFYGDWRGSGVSQSNVSLNFKVTARHLDVSVRPDGNGFRISWTTVRRQKGDPGNPTAERKAAEIRFSPSDKPNVWRATDLADPMGPNGYAWARLDRQVLTIHILAVRDDGSYEMQIYERALEGSGMKLEFTSLRNGDTARIVKGRLVKVAN